MATHATNCVYISAAALLDLAVLGHEIRVNTINNCKIKCEYMHNYFQSLV